ncbi:unnamed protein product [Gordionus sp. m RMFG-2023]
MIKFLKNTIFNSYRYYINSLIRSSLFQRINTVSSIQTSLTEGEKKIYDRLKDKFPNATFIEVIDISGGCGGMYNLVVCSPDFKGLKSVKQHQLVNEALKEETSDLHGWRIHTSHETEP